MGDKIKPPHGEPYEGELVPDERENVPGDGGETQELLFKIVHNCLQLYLFRYNVK